MIWVVQGHDKVNAKTGGQKRTYVQAGRMRIQALA